MPHGDVGQHDNPVAVGEKTHHELSVGDDMDGHDGARIVLTAHGLALVDGASVQIGEILPAYIEADGDRLGTGHAGDAVHILVVGIDIEVYRRVYTVLVFAHRLDSVETEGADSAAPGTVGEQIPPSGVLLQIIGRERHRPGCLVEVFVGDGDRCTVANGMEKRGEVFHAQFPARFLERNHLGGFGLHGHIEAGEHLVQPVEARNPLEAAEEGQGLPYGAYMAGGKMVVENGEGDVLVAVFDFTGIRTTFEADDVDMVGVGDFAHVVVQGYFRFHCRETSSLKIIVHGIEHLVDVRTFGFSQHPVEDDDT